MKPSLKVMIAAALALTLVLAAAGCGQSDSGDGGFVDIDAQEAQPTPEFQAFPDEAVPGGPNATPDPNAAGLTVEGEGDIPAERTPDPNATPTPTPRYSEADLDGEDEATPAPKRTYEEYRALNSDVVGWIDVPGTNVQYPIVHGTDNDYYLTHSVEKTASKSGAIFLDASSRVNAKYSVVFGHNMKNGTMFHGLNEYSKSDFYKNHREFELTWGDNTYTYKVFAVYSVDEAAAKYFYRDSSFESDAQFAHTMNELAKNSKYDVDTTIAEGDKVITLSTCNRTDYANGRFAIHAVLVK